MVAFILHYSGENSPTSSTYNRSFTKCMIFVTARFYHFSNEAVAVEFVSKLKDKYTEWHPHRYYVYDESHGNASYSTMCPSHGRYEQ